MTVIKISIHVQCNLEQTKFKRQPVIIYLHVYKFARINAFLIEIQCMAIKGV